jgi:hypothetical protein
MVYIRNSIQHVVGEETPNSIGTLIDVYEKLITKCFG